MAKPTVAQSKKFFVRLSDGDSPPSFVAPCGFTSSALNQTKNLGEMTIPDCDPDEPSVVVRDVESKSWSVTGEGVLAKSATSIWQDAYDSNYSIECEIEIVYEDGDSELWTGKFHVSDFNVSRSDGSPRVTASISMQSDGDVIHTRPT